MRRSVRSLSQGSFRPRRLAEGSSVVFARVTTIDADLSDEVLAFRERVLEEARASRGFRGALDLRDAARGRAIAVTLWETEDALRGSERAGRPRTADDNPRVEV